MGNVVSQADPRSKPREFEILEGFQTGYRNREDVSVLPPGVMVQGSQNVLTNTFGRIGIRKGYTLDGAASTDLAPIRTAFDWPRHVGDTKHVRAGFLTSALNDGKLQWRAETNQLGADTVTYFDLLTGLTSVDFNYTNFWDFNTELKDLLLMVNGGLSVYEWSGATATFASDAATTLTIEGSRTAGQLGFYQNGTRGFQIMDTGGTIRTFTYTGGEGTQTFTTVSPDPTAFTFAVGAPVWQTVRTTLNSAITSMPTAAPWQNDLISVLRNQIHYGCLTQNSVYVSVVNNYKSVAFTSPVRVVGEGARIDLDGAPTALIPQEDVMYISAGKDYWYQTYFQLDSTNAKEAFLIKKLKTTALQAALSQSLCVKTENSVAFVSQGNDILTLGRVEQIFSETPQISDIGQPIINDLADYDFTGGTLGYRANMLYVAIPAESRVLMYNMTDPNAIYWEAPQILALQCFSLIDGELYGHSSLTSESYKLFDGYNDNGSAIETRAVFSYNNHGTRFATKSFMRYYIEGYIASNTELNLQVQYDMDGCATTLTKQINGDDTQIVCIGGDANSLGKDSLGKEPLGGDIADETGSNPLPPKFRVIKTFVRLPFYEQQTTIWSNGKDLQWELIAFGPAASPTSEGNNPIVQ